MLDILIGCILLFFPKKVMHVIIYLFAVYIIAHGIINLFGHFKKPACELSRFSLLTGILMILIGLCMFPAATTLASILPVFIGFFLMLFGFIRISVSFLGGERIDPFSMVISILIVFGGMLSILFPISSLSLLLRVLGIIELFVAVTELISLWRNREE